STGCRLVYEIHLKPGRTNLSSNLSSEMTSMIVIRQADARKTVTAFVGDTIEVLLDENPSTGYRWQVSELNSDVLVLSGSLFLHSGETVAGSSGLRQLQFDAQSAGETVLLLKLKRPWENETDAIAQFQVTIQVLEK
ncbi:MAG: protease inhibitor I42 family protein, partial [Thainema sp.]